jgi:type II secretory pathway component PulL
MKKIGFIDIHPQSAGGLQEFLSSGEEGQEAGDVFIYLFTRDGEEFRFEKTLGYASHPETADIGEFYLSIPIEVLNFRILNLPFGNREKLQKVIPFELDNLITGGSANVVFDTIVLDRGEDSTEVLVAYIERKTLYNLLTKLARRDIDPRIVTSLDLRSVVGAEKGDIAWQLLNPEKLQAADRIDAAKEELSAYTLNLRTGPFAYTKDTEKMWRRLKKTALIGIVLALVINADLLFRTITTRQEVSVIKREMRNVYAGLFPGEKKIADELYQMKSHIKDIKENGDLLLGVNPLQFLMYLSEKRSDGAVYNEIDLEKGLIKLKAEAVSMEAINQAKASLSKYLSDVSVSEVKPAVNGKLFFTVVAKGRYR